MSPSRDDPNRQVADFIGRYSPEMAESLAACRRKLRERVSRGFELVYDNYNALAIGYAYADKASASLVSIAGYPRWVTLFFLYGKDLPDPRACSKARACGCAASGWRRRTTSSCPPCRGC